MRIGEIERVGERELPLPQWEPNPIHKPEPREPNLIPEHREPNREVVDQH